MGGNWYCEKFGFDAPQLFGVEVCDEETGDWSFLLLAYGFLWKMLHTWAGHFATAHQMATLLKALSESGKLRYTCFDDFAVNNMPRAFAEQYGLPFSELGYSRIYTPIVRLPVTENHSYQQDNQVQWLGLGNITSNIRA